MFRILSVFGLVLVVVLTVGNPIESPVHPASGPIMDPNGKTPPPPGP